MEETKNYNVYVLVEPENEPCGKYWAGMAEAEGEDNNFSSISAARAAAYKYLENVYYDQDFIIVDDSFELSLDDGGAYDWDDFEKYCEKLTDMDGDYGACGECDGCLNYMAQQDVDRGYAEDENKDNNNGN